MFAAHSQDFLSANSSDASKIQMRTPTINKTNHARIMEQCIFNENTVYQLFMKNLLLVTKLFERPNWYQILRLAWSKSIFRIGLGLNIHILTAISPCYFSGELRRTPPSALSFSIFPLTIFSTLTSWKKRIICCLGK